MNRPLSSHSFSVSSIEALAKIRIVLSHPSHPGNIGAVARAMKNMGLAHLCLVNPRIFPSDEASARAAGADEILSNAVVCNSLDEALADIQYPLAVSARQRDLGPEPLSVREAAPHIFESIQAQQDLRVALVFGNETSGLSNAEVQRCRRTVFIASNPEFASLNLAAAVQVFCYELRLAAFQEKPPLNTQTTPFTSPLASHEDIERFYQHLQTVMVATDFLDPKFPKRLMPKLRRLFSRTSLERDEINILRGILDAVEKKIR